MKPSVALIVAAILAVGFALLPMGADFKAFAESPGPASSTPAAPPATAASAAFSWEAVTAISTAVVAVLTLGIAIFNWALVRETRLAVERQLREQRQSHSVDLMLKMSGRWESAELAQVRRQLATLLVRRRANDQFDGAAKNALLGASQQVMSFFETLGIMVARAGVDPEIVWGEFAYWTIRYYLALEASIERMRADRKDRSFYASFQWLCEQLLAIDAKRNSVPVEHARPNSGDIDNFLAEERALPG